MKILVISDIHGGLESLKKVLDFFENNTFDKIFICGDILNHGPRNPLPKGWDTLGCANLLNKYRDQIVCVQGNCDSEVDQMLLNFPVLGSYSYYNLFEKTIFLTHGHNWGPDKLPNLKLGDILISGHTHIPECSFNRGIIHLNPGSISLPKGGNPGSFGVISNNKIEILSLDDFSTMFSLVL